MSYTVAALKRLRPGTTLAVCPGDAWPHGRWEGTARRNLHDWASREAVPARFLGIGTMRDPDDGTDRTVARVTYLPPASGGDAYMPGAIIGTWEELEQLRAERAQQRTIAERAATACETLGPGCYPAEPISEGHAVVLTIEAAERLAKAGTIVRAELSTAREQREPAKFLEHFDIAHRWALELLAPEHP